MVENRCSICDEEAGEVRREKRQKEKEGEGKTIAQFFFLIIFYRT